MSAVLKPKALSPGDTLAVLSPAGPTKEPVDAFEQGIWLLEAEGFRVKLMPHARNKACYTAGTASERLSDLHAAFADPEVKGILCARGGYGSMHLLPQLDFELIQKNPKVFIGFSDITALLLPFYQRSGLAGFYGPMLTSNLICDDPASQRELFAMVCGKNPTPFQVPNQDPYHCFIPGVAEGPLIGGNLSLLTALCGTPYQPDTRGHLLFIEDWHERYYSLDRQFTQLKLAGLLDGIQGLILCNFSEIDPEPDYNVTELLRRLSKDLDVPTGYGFSVGHGEVTATLPIGIRARWDATKGSLTLLESAILL